MLARFRSEVLASMDAALWAAGAEHPAAKELRAEVALGLNSIATDFTWADEFQVSLQLRQEALAIGVNTHVIGSINEGIARVAENARQEKLFRELIPMKGTPGLSTINGVGGKLYGSSNHDPGTGSFETTYYFTVLYFPIIPLSRYRVIQEGNSYRFLGKLRFRKFDKWHLGIVLGGIAFALLFGMVTSSSSTTSQSTSYQASPSTSYQSSCTSSSSESSSVTAEQSEIKSQIDAGRARLEILKTELEPVVDEMGTLKTQIQELDSQIKALDDQKSLGESIDTEEYNSKINEYNDLISRRKSLLAANQSSFDEYEDLRKKDSQLVAQYNALIR